jgi:hypothetical protein
MQVLLDAVRIRRDKSNGVMSCRQKYSISCCTPHNSIYQYVAFYVLVCEMEVRVTNLYNEAKEALSGEVM